jgi:outer membrane protein assembly factor BamD (BamD/ComL family)
VPASLMLGVAMISVVFVAPKASADPTSEEKAVATSLFMEAKTLLDANRVAEACRKLEESERLNPVGGTLLNLAVCHEREGRTLGWSSGHLV